MPHWKCGNCQTEFVSSPAQPKCWKMPACKSGAHVYEYTPTTQAVAIDPDTNPEGAATEMGYAKDKTKSVKTNYEGKGDHKPNSDCFIHKQGKFAISRDGSTHSSGRAAWKGFQKTGNKWVYLGSYDNGLYKVDRGGTGKQKTGKNKLPTS